MCIRDRYTTSGLPRKCAAAGHISARFDSSRSDSGDGKIALAVAINLGLTVAQVIGGIVAGSLSLIADALHNFSDAIALIIAFAARKIARRPANADMTFGYGRIEAVAALSVAQLRRFCREGGLGAAVLVAMFRVLGGGGSLGQHAAEHGELEPGIEPEVAKGQR